MDYRIAPRAVTRTLEHTAQRDIDHLLHPFTNLAEHATRGPVLIERGEGVFVFDEAGKEYLEGISGLWCTSLGFGEEALVEAAVEQMRRLPYYHTAMHKSVRPVIDLADKLKSIAPGTFSKVFMTGSGSEANETQIKLLWYYNNALGRPKKKTIISRINAYHGSTVAAASLSGVASSHRDFDLPIRHIKHVSCPHFYRDAQPGETETEFSARLADELEQCILSEGPETIAAFIAEPVMAAGGIILPPADYFSRIQAVLHKYDIRLIADEVICGFGRTGNMWGTDTFGLTPQSLSCAKALSSAYIPIGAVLIDEPMYQATLAESRTIGTFGHGFTFGGHPVAAAVALRVLQLMEERDIVGHVRRVSVRFQKRLGELGASRLVGQSRGCGLLGALELVASKTRRTQFDPRGKVGAWCAARCEHYGLIVRPLEDTIALCPPLIISETEIDALFDRLGRALEDTEVWVAREGMANATG